MSVSRRGWMRVCRVGVSGLVLMGLGAAGAGGVSAAGCGGSGAHSVNVGAGDNVLNGVAATSACSAWAVGYYHADKGVKNVDRTLAEHWNGKAWKVARSPNLGGPASDNSLLSVAAVAPRDAWAVGYYQTGKGVDRTLVEHWNGKVWKVERSPNLGGSTSENVLSGVAAVSAHDAWTVGSYYNGTTTRTLVEHWNGKAWNVQKSPDPPSDDGLSGVAALSPNDAWTVGSHYNHRTTRTLVEHWNGKAWRVQKSPDPSSRYNHLSAVTAASPSDTFAVGLYVKGPAEPTLVEHWNGKAWKMQKSLNPGGSTGGSQLCGVAAVSASDAFAVGYYHTGKGADRTLVEHWNGKAWKAQKSPDPSTEYNILFGVAAVSRSDAFAVGYYSKGTADRTLIERWNGTDWQH